MRSRHYSVESGFTLTELMIVVAVLALLVAIALPNFAKARDTARAQICISNLTLMEKAKAQAALELNWYSSTGPASIGNPLYRNTISSYIRGEQRPKCPLDFECFYNAVNELADCQSKLPEHALDAGSDTTR